MASISGLESHSSLYPTREAQVKTTLSSSINCSNFSKSGSDSDFEDPSSSSSPGQLYHPKDSVESFGSEISCEGAMTPPTHATSAIRKTLTSLGILEGSFVGNQSEQHTIIDKANLEKTQSKENSADRGNLSPRSLSRSITATSTRTRGPPPPRPKRLRLPAGATAPGEPSSPHHDDRNKVLDLNEGTRRTSSSSTASRSSSPFLRRSSQISIPPTSPPLCPLPATPTRILSSPTTQFSETENHQSTLNPFEQHFGIFGTDTLVSTQVKRSPEMSAVVSGGGNSLSVVDNEYHPELFFYRPPPPRNSSLNLRNSLTISRNSSDRTQATYHVLELAATSLVSTQILSSNPSDSKAPFNSSSNSEEMQRSSLDELGSSNMLIDHDTEVSTIANMLTHID